jgi:hypothetical protein
MTAKLPACLPARPPACPQLESHERFLLLKQIEVEKLYRERGLLPAASSSAGHPVAVQPRQEAQQGQA